MAITGRDTPPSIQDGPLGFEPAAVSNFDMEGDRDTNKLDGTTAIKIGREAWNASTTWLNAGRRMQWANSLRAFNSMHPTGSKYGSGDYRFRSTFFRPKTRSMVRRGEMQVAAAFFSNEDVVSITAADDDDPQQQASAEIQKALLQYRLTNTIPWFLTLVGARQDCDVMGVCAAKVGWEYAERKVRTERRPRMGPDGQPVWKDGDNDIETEMVTIFEVTRDRPFIDLLAPENFRYDPGCDWRRPVESSPYLIEACPVYIGEALEKMEGQNGAKPEWNRIEMSALQGAGDLNDDVTRRAREAGRIPGQDDDGGRPAEYGLCWTRIHTARWRGEDWYFRTLAGSGALLENPRPLREVHLHGQRPYVVGNVVVEAHKTYPSGKVELSSDLQRMANEDMNSRFDAVKLNLQPRQFVKVGAQMDSNDLQRFYPGRVVQVNAGKGEALESVVTWDRPPPVDGASFQEQDRINLDWDDLSGSFSNASVRSSEVSQQSATGMNLMSGEAGGLGEYELRVFAETFVEPVLKLMMKAEAAYETDPTILALAGGNAKLFQRFNVSEITDELLNHDVTLKVNVGVGATNPQMKLRNLATGAQVLGSIFGPIAAQGTVFSEVAKEIFGCLGYKDGARFFEPGFDPAKEMLKQQLAKAQGKGDGQGQDDGPAKIQIANINAQAKIQAEQLKAEAQQRSQQLDFHTQAYEEQMETQREQMRMQGDFIKAQHDRQHEIGMAGMDMQHQQATQGMQMQHDAQQQQAGFSHQANTQQAGFEHQSRQQDAQFGHQSGMQGEKLDHDASMGHMAATNAVNQANAKPPPMKPGVNGKPGTPMKQTPIAAPPMPSRLQQPVAAPPAQAPQQGNGEIMQLATMFLEGLKQVTDKQDAMMQQNAQAIAALAQAISGKVQGAA